MKTSLSLYDPEGPYQPFKRQCVEPQAFDLPSELWSTIIFDSLESSLAAGESKMLVHLANLENTCKAWNKHCWNLRVQLCQKVSFEALFQLPCHKDVNKIESKALDLFMHHVADIEELFKTFEFVNDLTSSCMHFLQTRGSQVQSIIFEKIFNYENFNTVLKAMPNLQELWVYWPTDDICGAVSQATKLKILTLDLVVCTKDGEGLKALSTLPLLEELNIPDDRSEVGSGHFISGLTTLKYLEIRYSNSEDITEITTLQNLTYLDIESDAYIEPVNFILHLTNLTFLNFSFENDLTIQEVVSIIQLPALTEANFAVGPSFKEQDLSQLTSFTNLYQLSDFNFCYRK